MPRLTRKQKQEHTRSSLLQSAAKVFCRKGMERASIDEVAEEAGYTKGAFYANFKSKQELFLAMLDERFAQRIRETDEAFSDSESPPEQARHAAAHFARTQHSDPDVTRLFFEFYSQALRDEDFRQELLTRFGSMRKRLAGVYQRRADETGIDPPLPMDKIANIVIAMADGWAMWNLLDPEGVDDEALESMYEIFTVGIAAVAGAFGELELQPAGTKS